VYESVVPVYGEACHGGASDERLPMAAIDALTDMACREEPAQVLDLPVALERRQQVRPHRAVDRLAHLLLGLVGR
jgi:hypothetical protein